MRQKAMEHASAAATILVIDDEKEIRQFLCELLTLHGHRTLAAQDGPTALTIYKRQFREIDLVLTDFAMPGLSGTETLAAMRVMNPTLKSAIMTGYCHSVELTEECQANVIGMLRKPFPMEQLLGLLDKAMHCGTIRDHSLMAAAEAYAE